MTTLEFEGMPSFTLAFDNVSGGGGTGTGYPIASQPEAEVGTSNTSLMTPLRTHQAIDARIATEAEAAAGVSTTELITPATMRSSVKGALWFFDRAGDALAVTIPDGVDVIYRLGYLQRGDHDITRFRRGTTTAPTNNLAWEKDASGTYFINDMPRVDVRTLGAKGDLREVVNGSITAGSADFTSSGANFTAADVGKWVHITAAGPLIQVPAGSPVWTNYFTSSIVSITSTSTVVLANAATNTVTGAIAAWGTDDSTPLFNACRAASTLQRYAYVPAGNYLVTTSISGGAGWHDFRLGGDGDTSRLVHGSNISGNQSFTINIVGAFLDRTFLTAPATALDNPGREITVSALTAMVPENYIMIADKAQPIANADNDPGLAGAFVGEFNRIQSVSGSTLTLHHQLQEDYLALPTAGVQTRVWEVAALRNCHIHHLSFDHLKPITTSGCAHIGSSRTIGMKVENCLFRNSNSNAVTGGLMMDGLIEGCRFEKLYQKDGDGLDGLTDPGGAYGINFSAGWNSRVANCTAHKMRHFITLFGLPTGIPTHHVHISGCTGTESPGPQFDTHGIVHDITFDDCHAIAGSGDYITTKGIGAYGFQIRSDDSTVSNCSATGFHLGFNIAFPERTRILNCQARNCMVGLQIWNAPHTEVRGFRVINPKTCGVRVQRSLNTIASLGKIILDDVRIYGNPTIPFDTYDAMITLEPCGFQFGLYNSDDSFSPQWEDQFQVTNWWAPDCTLLFKGGSNEGFYGPGIIDNLTAQNMPRDDIAATAVAMLTSGTMFTSEIDLKDGRRISKLGAIFGTAGTGQTNLWFGLFDRNRNLVAKTADFGATAPTPNVVTLGTLDRVHISDGGRYYIGICQAAATPSTVYGRTMPTALAALSPVKAGSSNAGLTTPASYPQIASATSTTSLPIELGIDTKKTKTTPTLKITTQSGKAFVVGMRVKIASTASPTNYMLAVVTKYSTTSLWVIADAIGGSGTFADWTITADAVATALTATGNIAFVATA